ncbi:hypothetical protein [Deinococcus sp. Leaf326]|uniref:hypothetical protein n=1 Tax=Deinococcus sp. Leaf326 TaxID=1736338 RepID=UPI0006F7C03C|nr:hypothetical protein [Deinococcus sp. Leaf326]KQR37729.1 hypothetical protein ASF71_14710 [Deinococcus sp. Leaf326]
MQNALLRNPNVLDASNITTAGRQVYGIRKGDGGKFTDFGVIESATPARENTERNLTGNRKGRGKTYKKAIADSTFSLTFQTSATGDLTVREWFLGSKAIVTPAAANAFAASTALVLGALIEHSGRVYRVAKAGTTDAAEPTWPTEKGLTVESGTVTFVDAGTVDENAVRAYSNDANIGEGAFIVIASTEESDGARSIIRVFPNGSITGDDEPTIQEYDGYQFVMTALSNRAWAPPVILGDFASARPDGVIYDVPNDRVEEAVNLLATSLATYIEA